jgi:hypothetical protein
VFSQEFGLFENNFPNHPVRPVIKYQLLSRNGRWKTVSPSGRIFTARGRHVFVVQNGLLIVSKEKYPPGFEDSIGHIDLAGGRPIEFGGEIVFGSSRARRGILVSWNDQTGHYCDSHRAMNPDVVPLLPADKFIRTGTRS